MTDQDLEAQTMVTWGRGKKEVVGFLVDGGSSPAAAFKQVSGLIEQRNSEIRRRGYRRFIVGGVILLVSALLIRLYLSNL